MSKEDEELVEEALRRYHFDAEFHAVVDTALIVMAEERNNLHPDNRIAAGVAVLVAEKQHMEFLRKLAEPFEDDECRYDHHGYCQEHFLQPMPCPIGVLKEKVR